ncbi:hypothetical protein [Vulcanococcus limneticus]|uniref:hypothetical protein n=1 Tax=Vulcanococcus limneticus TaxID=2170428 RepID=UPI00398BE37D
MTLVQIWKENPEQIRAKRVDQIIGFAGDGKLGDNNSAPSEFRDFLARVPGELIAKYANDCLESAFKDSGLALQDIVNEIATRLGFTVEPGRYRGTKADIGHDGIWTAPNNHAIVAEVKTTDAYRLPIETVATYRRRLIKAGRITEDHSSILIIVGREDTGELEAQIRGSRYAWDVRLISIDAFLRLMKIRQDLDSPSVEERIRAVLIPREYTRVDEIIDLVFSTTEDILDEVPDELGEENEVESAPGAKESKDREKPVSFNLACVERIGKSLHVELTKQSRVIFGDLDSGLKITCAVSKEYKNAGGLGYWFAFHQHQLETLSEAPSAYACFGCGSPERIAILPFNFIKSQLEGMNQTTREDGRMYWHVQIHKEGERWIMHRRKGFDWPDITSMMLVNNERAT